jgi:hypothetical protein
VSDTLDAAVEIAVVFGPLVETFRQLAESFGVIGAGFTGFGHGMAKAQADLDDRRWEREKAKRVAAYQALRA